MAASTYDRSLTRVGSSFRSTFLQGVSRVQPIEPGVPVSSLFRDFIKRYKLFKPLEILRCGQLCQLDLLLPLWREQGVHGRGRWQIVRVIQDAGPALVGLLASHESQGLSFVGKEPASGINDTFSDAAKNPTEVSQSTEGKRGEEVKSMSEGQTKKD